MLLLERGSKVCFLVSKNYSTQETILAFQLLCWQSTLTSIFLRNNNTGSHTNTLDWAIDKAHSELMNQHWQSDNCHMKTV